MDKQGTGGNRGVNSRKRELGMKEAREIIKNIIKKRKGNPRKRREIEKEEQQSVK